MGFAAYYVRPVYAVSLCRNFICVIFQVKRMKSFNPFILMVVPGVLMLHKYKFSVANDYRIT